MHHERLHALDNLRAILALLGVPFHVAFLLFLRFAAATNNANLDLYHLVTAAPAQYQFIFCDIFYLHTFRMPAFFLLAGFFAHWLYQRLGAKHFLKNRLLRVGLPFLFLLLWLIPSYLERALFMAMHEVMSQHQSLTGALYQVIKQQDESGFLWQYFTDVRDSWFLYDLLWFYGLTLLCLSLNHKLPRIAGFKQKMHAGLQSLLFSPWLYFFIPLFCSLLLLRGHSWYAILDTHLDLSWSLLIFYSIWYLLGWHLWQHKESLMFFNRWAMFKIAVSIILYRIYLAYYFHFINSQSMIIEWLGDLMYSLIAALMVFSLIGLAWRYLDRAQRFLKYLSEASYWIYLIQVPILIIVMLVLMSFTLSVYWLFSLATLFGTLLCVLSYQLLVRHTWLEAILGCRSAEAGQG